VETTPTRAGSTRETKRSTVSSDVADPQAELEANRRALVGYLERHDTSYLADDAVFIDMSAGTEYSGRDEVERMLHWFYSEAFDATGETSSLLVDGDHGVWEGWFVGRHTGDFAGIPATGKDVRVPIIVSYDLQDGKIERGRFYLAMPALMSQLGVTG
jgi:predicted ester cyclase